ncbi:hypothetical protein ABH926_006468 [Catenulispora sp. GP43]|jgi:hypothetical protein|uniref:hypothetical protein n=1 Tax=Catenulispora sp. GP43 TaxID=3156263 RepID=UPI00351569E5
MSTTIDREAPLVRDHPEHNHDAYRDVLLAVQRALAANWDDDQPRIAVVERNGISTVYVSTIRAAGSAARLDIRGAVRAALAPYSSLAPYTKVIFLQRGAP